MSRRWDRLRSGAIAGEVAQRMGWERGYYSRSRKVNGRMVKEYVGTGRVAELAAQLDAIKHQEREHEKAAWQEEKARLDALDANLAALIEMTDLVATAALLAAGFHQHKRQWRRKRHGNDNSADGSGRRERTGKDPTACSQRR